MLTKKEIEGMRPKLSLYVYDGETDRAYNTDDLCNQAAFAASLVEFIEGLEIKQFPGGTDEMRPNGSTDEGYKGHNELLRKIKTFIKENQ